jgi:hypothetical protein
MLKKLALLTVVFVTATMLLFAGIVAPPEFGGTSENPNLCIGEFDPVAFAFQPGDCEEHADGSCVAEGSLCGDSLKKKSTRTCQTVTHGGLKKKSSNRSCMCVQQ